MGRTQPKVPAPLRPWALVTACPDEAEGADAGRSSAWGFSCLGLRGQWVSGDLHYFLSVEHLRPARLPLPPRGAPPVWIFTLHRLRGPRVLGPGGGQLFWDIPPSLSHVGETAPEIRGRVWGGVPLLPGEAAGVVRLPWWAVSGRPLSQAGSVINSGRDLISHASPGCRAAAGRWGTVTILPPNRTNGPGNH